MRGLISRRAAAFDSSGIRKAFDRAATIADPINLAIGQPDFAMPAAAREGAKAASDRGATATRRRRAFRSSATGSRRPCVPSSISPRDGSA